MALKGEDIQKIISGIQLGISAAPQVIALVEKGKEFIDELFNAELISAATQNRSSQHLDDVAEAFRNNQSPPEFQVEPDPSFAPTKPASVPLADSAGNESHADEKAAEAAKKKGI